MKEIEKLEIISLVDNCGDFLSSINKKKVQTFRKWTKKRYGMDWAKICQLPVAEHGFSLMIRVQSKRKTKNFLFDTGGSPNVIIQNAARMNLDLKKVDSIVLSHSHYDHSGGLTAVLKATKKGKLPVIIHKDMQRKRGVINTDGTIREYPPFPTMEQMKSAEIIETKQPKLFLEDMVLVTGEIPRKTEFEKGYLPHRFFENGFWKPDPWIWDDRAIAINLKEKGLIIISGCAHAGIINTINYIQELTGITKTYAILGGFHLSGEEYEKIINATLRELVKKKPEVIVPTHCTGWRGKCAISQILPDAFVWNSVGNLYEF